MGSRKSDENILDDLAELPWWVSVIFAAAVYIFLRFILPMIDLEDGGLERLLLAISDSAYIACLFLLPAAASALRAFQRRRLLDRQTGIESIRSLSWKDFEVLMGEAFRRRGYAVVENPGRGTDGGIDLTLRKDGNVYLVQCKHWRSHKVGVKVVREMLGLVTAHRAQGAIIVTTGLFTQEARIFAEGVPIDLIEGNALAEMISSVKRGSTTSAHLDGAPSQAAAQEIAQRFCTRCGAELVVRKARRGVHAGNEFWGCSRFPTCRYTEPVEGASLKS